MAGKLILESFAVGVRWQGDPRNPHVRSTGVEVNYYVNGHRIDERTYRLIEEMIATSASLAAEPAPPPFRSPSASR